MKRFFSLIIIFSLFGCGRNHLLPNKEPDPIPSVCIPHSIRLALVLGSGGVRGMAHVGVIEELEKAGIPIDLIVGCSAGSLVGALYANYPQSIATREVVYKIRSDSLLDIDFWNCRYGLSQGRSMLKVLNQHLMNKQFKDLKIPLIIVASDLYTGELVPIASGDLVKAIQASCSIPFVFVPCKHMGRILVDGGVINPVPVKIAKDLGAHIVVAVDLCELLSNTTPSNLFEITSRSAEIAFMWHNEICTHHADVIIRPKTRDVGTFNDDNKWQIYWAGRNAAREQIPKIKELLEASKASDSRKMHYVPLYCYKPQIEK